MTDAILTQEQIDLLFQQLTVTMTGLDSKHGVRMAWQMLGTPDWAITEDVVFLHITVSNDPYTQQIETVFGESETPNVLDTSTRYTRVHTVQWVAYGPNCSGYTDTIRYKLFLEESLTKLGAVGISPILDTPQVTRAPELFNGEWWDRADLTFRFYEGVRRYSTIPTLFSTEIIIVQENGQQEVIH